MTELAEIKVYVRKDNTATLECPACGAIKHIAADEFLHRGRHTITVRCRCQKTFSVSLDFRRYYRKNVSLPGTYDIISGGIGFGIININNVSRSGLSFTVAGRHRIEQDQELEIEFQLKDKKQTVLKRHAIVKSVQQNCIGCQLQDQLEEKDLGFFLTP